MNTQPSPQRKSLWRRIICWFASPYLDEVKYTSFTDGYRIGTQQPTSLTRPISPMRARALRNARYQYHIPEQSAPGPVPPPRFPAHELAPSVFKECGTNPRPGTFSQRVEQAIRAALAQPTPDKSAVRIMRIQVAQFTGMPPTAEPPPSWPTVQIAPDPPRSSLRKVEQMQTSRPASPPAVKPPIIPACSGLDELEAYASKSGILPMIEEWRQNAPTGEMPTLHAKRVADRAAAQRARYHLPQIEQQESE